MLIDVITRVAADTGYDLVQQRTALVRIANDAAKMLYEQLECNSIYREITLVVPPDSVVALPTFVGPIQGLKPHTNDYNVPLESLKAPRYVSDTLKYRYKNWRDLGDSPIHTNLSAIGPLSFYSRVVEDTPVVIKVTGETNLAATVEESVTIDEAEVEIATTNLFGPSIKSIICTSQRSCNIVIKDLNLVEIAVLYNNEPRTSYKVIDVSCVPWSLDTTAGETLMDVCYKVRLSKLINDADSFPAGDQYDDAWYNYAMHLFYKPQEGKEAKANLYFASALTLCKSDKDSRESGIVKKVNFGPGKFQDLFGFRCNIKYGDYKFR